VAASLKIHLLKEVHGNFGDDLNHWLWDALLPDVWSDEDDDVLFVGIGTILDKHLPPARIRIVFGTGAGYTSAPPDISASSSRWRIYGVRGPLTARALKLDKRFVMTDPAILLATLREFKGLYRRGVIFIPHWKSVRYGCWETICNELGIEFVDPCRDSKSVLRRIASAEKVIAESMHAAIIADAFRVPWIPIALSREVSPFKWVDWAASMDVPYRPVCLPASNRIERIRNALLKWSVHSNAAGYPSPGLVAQGFCMRFEDLDGLMSDFEKIGRRIDQKWRWNASMGLEVILKRLATLGLGPAAFIEFGASEQMLNLAAAHLTRLLPNEGYLSSDQVHHRSLDHTMTQLEEFRRDSRRGEFAGHRTPASRCDPRQ
jgi:succinoglycan biosynthesis protein ExoV